MRPTYPNGPGEVMPSADAYLPRDRRAILRGAILLAGGLGIAPCVLAATGKPYLAPADRATLDLLCETIIPRTDTPGALYAGVPAFLDELLASWASPATQERLRDVVMPFPLGRGRYRQAARVADPGGADRVARLPGRGAAGWG